MCEYFKSILYKEVTVKPSDLNKDLDNFILNNLKFRVEGRCIDEGYVREGSVNIIKKSNGFFSGSLFNGSVKFNVAYSADICNPSKGTVIKCIVKYINKLGIQAESGPLTIIIAKEFHNNKKVFKDIKQGDSIEVIVIDKLYNLNDKNISVAAKLKEDDLSLISNQNIELSDTKKDIVVDKIPLSSIDSFDEIDIDSLAEEIELDDTRTINFNTGTNIVENNEMNLEEEGKIESFEKITNQNNVGPETDTNLVANDSDVEDSSNSDEEESDVEENSDEESDENSNIESDESGDDLPNDTSEDENEEEYQDSSDEEQTGGDIKTIKIDKSMLLNNNEDY